MDYKRKHEEEEDEYKKTKKTTDNSTFYKCEYCDMKFRRIDSLQKHIRKKHQHEKVLEDSNREAQKSSQNTAAPHISDHNYVRQPVSRYNNTNFNQDSPTSSERNIEHNYAKPLLIKSDHDYTLPLKENSNTNDYHTHSSSTTKAINQTIQDHELVPNVNEEYDMLTFFANVKFEVTRFLKLRLMQNGIKWYLSIQVELVKDIPDQKSARPHFRSRAYASLNIETFEEHDLNEAFQKMFESFEKYIRESSGWVLKKVENLIVHTVDYLPISGSTFMELPKQIRHSRSLLNVRNLDQKCFLWCCLASLHPSDSPLISDYEAFEHELNMSGINYPVSIHQINRFEKQNPSISINILTVEDNDIIPLRITKQKDGLHHIDLLLLHSEHNSHYVLIKNLNNFLSYRKDTSCNKKYYCRFCLHGYTNEKLLEDHIPYCQVHGEQKIELPSNEDCFLKFKDFEKTLRVPYVIYADFETLNKRLEEDHSNTSTKRTQLLEPCSFGYKVISTDPAFNKETVLYKGTDAATKLMECLFRESEEIEQHLKNIKPLSLSNQEENSFQISNRCCLCQKMFLVSETKARHHDHTSGKFIGAAHMNCNLQCNQVKFIPIIFHNLKNFDGHLLCQKIGSFKKKKIQCIPQTMEKYISFSVGKLRFIDSFGFLPSSLETLTENLVQNVSHPFNFFLKELPRHRELLLRKGIYPYQYMDCWEKFDETELPPRKEFYSDIKKEHISEKEYNHAKEVFEKCECKTLADYHFLYLKVDVLLLTEIFEHFRDVTLQCYQLDPTHFYTSPGLSWSAMLKMTGVTLELLTDVDQILFIEKGIRGGVSQISNRYKTANNPYLADFDGSKDVNFLNYYDVNNLYGFSMSKMLPVGFFIFLNEEEISSFNVQSISEDGSKGYILEVDLEYPEHLHDTHNDYPLAPEHKSIPNGILSPYAQKLWKKLHRKAENDQLPPRAKIEKLLTTLENKNNYVLHYRNLQLYLQLGLKLKKIHRVLEFQQEAFMKPYIDFNTRMRQQAKSLFEKDFYKLMNNSCFGKTMENLRKHRTVELCHTEKRLKKLSAKPTYKTHRIFSEDLAGIELSRHKVKMNKPIYIGMTVLDLSKHTMYDFFYNHLKKIYGNSVELQMTDTDSFLFSCNTADVFQDMFAYSHLFDTSDFPKSHYLQSDINKKVMGKMKSETGAKLIKEYCGLRSKMYAYSCEGKEDKRAKGVAKVVVKNELTLEDYKNTLFDESSMKATMNLLRSHDHQMYCESINKISLCSFDDKRYLLEGGISSLAYGHYKIKQNLNYIDDQ